MESRTARQIALGLTAGTVVPLAVVAGLLLAAGEGEAPVRVVVAPSQQSAAAKGLKARTGAQLLPYLLTTRELGGGWQAPPGVAPQGQGSLDGPGPSLELPQECSGYTAAQFRALRTASAHGSFAKPRVGFFGESLYVFEPGMAEETMAFMRGLVARCGKRTEQFNLPDRKVNVDMRTKVAAGPKLGDESMRLVTTSRNASGQNEVYVRIGDTLLRCQGDALTDALVRQAYEKVS